MPSPSSADSWEKRCSEPGSVVRSMRIAAAGTAARSTAGVKGEWRKARARFKDYERVRVDTRPGEERKPHSENEF